VRVAVVWVRDGRAWRWLPGASAEAVRERAGADRKEGWLPVDVAGFLTAADEERFTTLWVKANKDEEAWLHINVSAHFPKAAMDALKKDKLIPLTVQALALPDRQVRYSGIWGEGAPALCNLSWDQRRGGFVGQNLHQCVVDVTLAEHDEFTRTVQELLGWLSGGPGAFPWAGLSLRSRAEPPGLFATVWHTDARYEEVRLAGLSPDAHRARCRELAALGYRPLTLNLATLASGAQAASVWHRPVVGHSAGNRLASRQANAAAMLACLGEVERTWELLRHSPDPTVRSHLVERLKGRGLPAQAVLARLEVEKDLSARRALILTLGEYGGLGRM
jgi:hypothetical protein